MSKGRGSEPELYQNGRLVQEFDTPPHWDQPGEFDRKKPTKAVRIGQFGSGWIDIVMDDGSVHKRTGGTISWRYFNPGNLKFGDFARARGALGAGWGNHAVFPTEEIGRKAKYELLFTAARGYNNLSIIQAMNKYAPASDKGKGVPKGGNQPNNYAKFIAKALNVSTSTKLSHLSENKKQQMLDAMRRYEGFKQGTIKRI